MNSKMSNQMFPITFINRKTSITRTNSTILLLYFSNVRNFSGGDNKRETAYNIWRCEVKMLMKESGYTRQHKDYAIRRSLTGSAAHTVKYEGYYKPFREIQKHQKVFIKALIIRNIFQQNFAVRNNVMMRMFLHGVTYYKTSYENALRREQ